MELTVILQAAAAAASNAVWGRISIIIGAALIVFAAGFSIGNIGQKALDTIARQPEAAGNARSSMILAAALVEGVSFFALIVCLLGYFA